MGVTFPSRHWGWYFVRNRYFTGDVMRDIAQNLHAKYVRLGWIPDWVRKERPRWRRQDQVLDAACGAGLRVLVLVPGPTDDTHGIRDEADNVREFFARYTAREPGCLRYAEIANEADLPKNGFSNVAAYARYYEVMAPIVASFGVLPITSGTSGEDVSWTHALAALLRDAKPSVPIGGYGFHPYNIPPAELAQAVREMRQAASAPGDAAPPNVYVTEFGETSPRALYVAIANLAHATPLIVIYEYRSQPSDDTPGYALVDHPALYDAVKKASLLLH